MVVPQADYEGGGYCGNKTSYCNFGCCGTPDTQTCCFPVGIYIGCGFGIIGAICLLVAVFRCRLACLANHGRGQEAVGPVDQQLAQVSTSLHSSTAIDVSCLPPSYGWTNPAFPFPQEPGTEMTYMCSKCRSLHNNLPPSYEECMNTAAVITLCHDQNIDTRTVNADSVRYSTATY